MSLACPHDEVTAPFQWQPSRRGLRGLGSFGITAIPIGTGAGPGAAVGASTGASIGSSILPGVGTAIGAAAGAIVGAITGSINKKDPEQYNFDAAVALWQQNPDAIYNIGNKYLVLAGLFDLNLDHACSAKWCIPMYVRYGRMGEQKFVNDFVNLIYNAAQNGQISASDTPVSIMARIVQPWINSWGYGPLNDPHADLINRLLTGMVWDYTDGTWKQNWHAVGGDFPFSSLPMFALPQAVVPVSTPQPVTNVNPVGSPTVVTPVPVVTATPVVQPTPTVTTVVTPPATSTIAPVGSSLVTYAPMPSAVQTPAQIVSVVPQVGSTLTYVPDLSNNSAPYQVPTGLVFVGLDPYNRSWIMQNPSTGQQYVLWQGSVVAYTPTMFGAQPSSATVATTSTGAPVTQADIQNLISQLTAQGQTQQQSYLSALQALQNSGVSATPQVQQAVQTAVAQAPAATGIGAALSGISDTGWLIIGGGLLLFLSGRRH